ncbi:OsmC family peroxiredoxin [Corallococcus sp. AB049A]|uniref:OsmC family peroxiredoxin n=1 Tax=Corallococcus interemptor TaxID=2316720 RepID=A0A3A8R3N0_9BACT|nr:MULTISPECIES: OsmC family protein [Corallococcus]RKH40265.1 OsmC family peroxiredoxin [Corallococcus sp. AB050B]RKH73840.1 OsmC family peroxiredoxin [Corallococcus interemptor]RKI52426.1 OsmC family peroxiredoxin [Corallococcus sp. AB049A]
MSQQPATGVVMSLVSAPQLKTKVTHGPSGATLPTEAPKDNGGTGGSFSPTDLVATALASCVVTTMHLMAGKEGITLGEVTATVEKRMTPPPRKIGELVLSILMPSGLTKEQRTTLEKIAHECPVARSLHPDVKVTTSFGYPD